MNLPDPEQLLVHLTHQLAPLVDADTAMVGLHTGGVWVAERLHATLDLRPALGTLDVSFYRDDFDRIGLHAEAGRTQVPFDVEGRTLILVDDVLYTGRTIRAAMNELFDFGRPARIVLAVLVDRGGRELPIGAQAVGTTLELPANQALWLERNPDGRLGFSLHASENNRS